MKKNSNLFIITILMILLITPHLLGWDNGIALTPPMGWSSWNIFGGSIDEAKIKSIADAMVSSGMKDAGYVYLNLDDNWMKANRDSNGNLAPDPTRFPSGMKALADYLHAKGLKLGLYGDRGTATCMNIPESGSQGYEEQDANTWASWGVDYIKVDSCNAQLDLRTQYELIHNYLAECGRSIVYSICCWYFVGPWMMDCGHLWRTTSDISDSFGSFTGILEVNEKLYPYAGPGHWNDPDMLEVGNGGCTFEEYKAHFSLWCLMAAPLIAGNDIRTMSEQTKTILLNKEVIAVDQDPAGIQGHRIRDDGDLEVWMKPLGSANGATKAVILFNRSGGSANISVNWTEIGLPGGSAYVRDLWQHKDLGGFNNSFSTSVPSHGVVMVTISSSNATPQPTTPTSISGDVNLDGIVDIVDALLIAQYSVGILIELKGKADVNCSSGIDIIDALLVAQYSVALITKFPC